MKRNFIEITIIPNVREFSVKRLNNWASVYTVHSSIYAREIFVYPFSARFTIINFIKRVEKGYSVSYQVIVTEAILYARDRSQNRNKFNQ